MNSKQHLILSENLFQTLLNTIRAFISNSDFMSIHSKQYLILPDNLF